MAAEVRAMDICVCWAIHKSCSHFDGPKFSYQKLTEKEGICVGDGECLR